MPSGYPMEGAPQTTQTTTMDADPPRPPLISIGNLVICKHRRIASKCIDCPENTCPRGSRQCSPVGQQSRSKESGDSAICPHGRSKWHCEECGGSAFCPHGRVKQTCKECGGSAFCPHGRQRSRCKDCSGSAFCPHTATGGGSATPRY